MAGRLNTGPEHASSDEQTQSSEPSQSVFLHFVSTPADLNDEGFPATCTHYVFRDDRQLEGYSGLEVDLFMHAGSMKPYFSITYDEKGPADLALLLKTELELPEVFQSPFELSASLQAEFKPPGQLLHSFTKAEAPHSIYLATADSPGFLDIHPYFNTLPVWFIDGASLVDITEPHWRYFLLYKEVVSGPCALVGMCSAYYFWSSLSSCRVRISQFLVLPQYQRRGYGADLLKAIYSYLVADACVTEITVEDCSEEMQRLRDTVDVQAALELIPWGQDKVTAECYPKTTDEHVKTLQKKLKITKNQAHRCLELVKLGLMNPKTKETQPYSHWRLEVKQRLMRDNYQELKPSPKQPTFKHIYIHDDSEAEEEAKTMQSLKSMSPALFEQVERYFGMKPVPFEGKTPLERKTALAEMFTAVEEEYESVLPKICELIAPHNA